MIVIGPCILCRRRHHNIGHRITAYHPIKWFCRECAPFMQEVVRMTKKSFDEFETAAMLEGGAAAGQFLDSIGQTDLAELNQDQFLLFFAKYAGGYETAMRNAIENKVVK